MNGANWIQLWAGKSKERKWRENANFLEMEKSKQMQTFANKMLTNIK